MSSAEWWFTLVTLSITFGIAFAVWDVSGRVFRLFVHGRYLPKGWQLTRGVAVAFVLGIGALVWWAGFISQPVPPEYNFLEANPAEIRAAMILPGYLQKWSLVQEPIKLSEKEIVDLCSILRTAKVFKPNHPGTAWCCKLMLDAGTLAVTLDVTNTQGELNGVVIYWWGPNRRYRCDALAPFLESIAETRSSKNRNSSSGQEP